MIFDLEQRISTFFLNQAIRNNASKILKSKEGREYGILDFSQFNPHQMKIISKGFHNRDYYFQYCWLFNRMGELFRASDLDLDQDSLDYLKSINYQEPTQLRAFSDRSQILLENISEFCKDSPQQAIPLIDAWLKENLSQPDYASFCRFWGGQLDWNGKITWIQQYSKLEHPENYLFIFNMLWNIWGCMEEIQNTAQERYELDQNEIVKAMPWTR